MTDEMVTADEAATADVPRPPADSLNYAIWPAGTEITLCNVPWDQQYRHAVRFKNRDDLNAYIDQRSNEGKVIDNVSYVRVSEPIYLADPFNTLWKYNYIRVSQPAQPTTVGEPDVPRDYYYFITDIQHVAPNTTAIRVSLDIYQTFIYDVEFGPCFVERSHLPIAQSNQMGDQGRRYLSAPEGLDTGPEYEIIDTATSLDGYVSPMTCDFVVYATCDLTDDWVDDKGLPVTPGPPENEQTFGPFYVPSGLGVWVLNSINGLNRLLRALKRAPHIGQTIIAIIAVPKVENYVVGYNYPEAHAERGLSVAPTATIGRVGDTMFNGSWRDSAKVQNHIPAKYRHLKKFHVYPFTLFEQTSYADNSLVLRPERFTTFGIYIETTFSPFLEDNRLIAYPLNYLNADGPASWTMFTTSGSLPHLGIVNDSAALSLAQNARTRAFQSQNANYAREKALRGNQNNYDAVTRGMNAAQAQSDLSGQYASDMQARQAARATEDAWIGGASGVAKGLAGGAAAGSLAGIPGAIIGGAVGAGGAALTGAFNLWNTDRANRRGAEDVAAANANAQASLNISNDLTRANRDANKALADWAANGDYMQSIMAQQAAVEDTQVTPPSVVAMPQGSSYAFANGNLLTSMFLKMVDRNVITRVGEFWLRYGYAVSEYLTPPQDMMCMDRFTYWKMTECNIVTAPMPETFRDAIRGMFEKGITIHRDPDSIGRDVENMPIMGRYY